MVTPFKSFFDRDLFSQTVNRYNGNLSAVKLKKSYADEKEFKIVGYNEFAERVARAKLNGKLNWDAMNHFWRFGRVDVNGTVYELV